MQKPVALPEIVVIEAQLLAIGTTLGDVGADHAFGPAHDVYRHHTKCRIAQQLLQARQLLGGIDEPTAARLLLQHSEERMIHPLKFSVVSGMWLQLSQWRGAMGHQPARHIAPECTLAIIFRSTGADALRLQRQLVDLTKGQTLRMRPDQHIQQRRTAMAVAGDVNQIPGRHAGKIAELTRDAWNVIGIN